MPQHLSIKRRIWLFVVSLLITCSYLLVGGLIMRQLERPLEDEHLAAGRAEMKHLVEDLGFKQSDLAKLEESELCDFGRLQDPHWSVTGSLFYTLTVITTIGYGSFAPITQSGRSFTTGFAIIGIGIIGQMLASCALLIRGIIVGLAQRVRHKDESHRELTPLEEQEEWEELYGSMTCGENQTMHMPACNLHAVLEALTHGGVDPGITHHVLSVVDPCDTGYLSPAATSRAVALWYQLQMELPRGVSLKEGILTIGIAGVWICLWAVGFMWIEGWSYREAMWFCFVSMSTIGFGDYVPQTKQGRMLSFMFIVPGLGMGATALGTLWDAFEARRYWWLQKRYHAGRVTQKMLEAHGIQHRIKDPAKCQNRRDFYANKPGEQVPQTSVGPGMVQRQTARGPGAATAVALSLNDMGAAAGLALTPQRAASQDEAAFDSLSQGSNTTGLQQDSPASPNALAPDRLQAAGRGSQRIRRNNNARSSGWNSPPVRGVIRDDESFISGDDDDQSYSRLGEEQQRMRAGRRSSRSPPVPGMLSRHHRAMRSAGHLQDDHSSGYQFGSPMDKSEDGGMATFASGLDASVCGASQWDAVSQSTRRPSRPSVSPGAGYVVGGRGGPPDGVNSIGGFSESYRVPASGRGTRMDDRRRSAASGIAAPAPPQRLGQSSVRTVFHRTAPSAAGSQAGLASSPVRSQAALDPRRSSLASSQFA
eukprot:TRINITY_DN25293_c0_g1_i1.p1 TRINITY_DN25293_c0_g1~~TRINITY_DN25293_c0_g1_i1.p1  ORF type:complete len:706 (+),score=111.74 TRINITY_DN25293_c0_g1_i1:124-2241(+)